MATPTNDQHLDDLVNRLNGLEAVTGWHRVLALGAMLIEGMFGDLETYKVLPEGEARRSFREVARHPDLRFPQTTLYGALVCTVVLGRLETAGVPARERLSPTHVRHLSGLSLDGQVDLAHKAILHGWVTRRLEKEARRVRRRSQGLPRIPLFERDLRRTERWARADVFNEESLEELGLASLSLDELDELAGRLESLEVHLGAKLARLRRRVKTLGGRLRKLPKHRRPPAKGATNAWAEMIREIGARSSSAA